MSLVAHYCQKCLAANPLGQEFCTRCGTRLMIIVEPAAARYDAAESPASSEEHLLERISSLENHLSRLTQRLERGLDLLLRQAQNSHFDRALVKSLVNLLTEDGLVDSDRLERLWTDRCEKDAEEQQESERREDLRGKILSQYEGPERPAFERLINQGLLFIDDEQTNRGIRALQRAIEMSAGNASLLFLLGEQFFKKGKTGKAHSYLSKAHQISPKDNRISLLLGLTCADKGETEQAKALLSRATQMGSSFAAHYGLGRVFIAEEKWLAALHEFKLALASKDSPEAHYALGCLYYQLCRDSLATRHLRKALEMDGAYNEASYLLELISKRPVRKERPGEFFEDSPVPPKSVPARNKRQPAGQRATAPLFRTSSARPPRLITGGDRRLAEALRQDALHACNTAELERR